MAQCSQRNAETSPLRDARAHRRSVQDRGVGGLRGRGRAASMFAIAIATNPNTRRGNRMHPRYSFLTTKELLRNATWS